MQEKLEKTILVKYLILLYMTSIQTCFKSFFRKWLFCLTEKCFRILDK